MSEIMKAPFYYILLLSLVFFSTKPCYCMSGFFLSMDIHKHSTTAYSNSEKETPSNFYRCCFNRNEKQVIHHEACVSRLSFVSLSSFLSFQKNSVNAVEASLSHPLVLSSILRL